MAHGLFAMADSAYHDYLKSAHWRRFRKHYKRMRPWRCVCGATDDLELHHKTYARLGHERLDDVRPLCPSCHALIHDLKRVGQIKLDLSNFSSTERKRLYARQSEAMRNRRDQENAEPRTAKPWDKHEIRISGSSKERTSKKKSDPHKEKFLRNVHSS